MTKWRLHSFGKALMSNSQIEGWFAQLLQPVRQYVGLSGYFFYLLTDRVMVCLTLCGG
jgi:hypothetical protein